MGSIVVGGGKKEGLDRGERRDIGPPRGPAYSVRSEGSLFVRRVGFLCLGDHLFTQVLQEST